MGIENQKCSLPVKYDLDREMDGIVRKVLPGSDGKREFELNALEGKYTVKEVDKVNVDETRPLKNVATDLVVNEFFKSEDSLYNFLSYVYVAFEKVLDKYIIARALKPRDVFFLHKGGNILRIVSKEFLLELPSSATREITDFYANFFKRGDADFAIYVNPYLKDYDNIFHELTLVSYLLQDGIRKHFAQNLMQYFDIFRFNQEYQRSLFRPYLDLFNNSEGFENMFTDFKIGELSAFGKDFEYANNPDVTMKFIREDENWLKPVRRAAIKEIKSNLGIMTVTHNNALDFVGGNEEVREKFNLTRTKFIFTLLQTNGRTRNVGGELIDVGIQHRLASSTAGFFKLVDQYVATYTMNYKNITEFTFNSYSIKYLTYDLENILFVQRPKPWVDRKYDKRLNRLAYMHFIDIFVKLENAQEKISILRSIIDTLSVYVSDVSDIRTIKRFMKRYAKLDLNILSMMEEIVKLQAKLVESDFVEMETMIDLLIQNFKFLMDAVNNVKDYCSVQGDVDVADLYNINVNNFL